jgi:hypothetical protein
MDFGFSDYNLDQDPDCYGGCFHKGDRVRSHGREGTVRWVGSSTRQGLFGVVTYCRLGVSFGPGPLHFFYCHSLQLVLRPGGPK